MNTVCFLTSYVANCWENGKYDFSEKNNSTEKGNIPEHGTKEM